MKKLIVLVAILLNNLTSFSQNVTKTASDSVVIMNKKLVQYMVQDLIRYDADKQALNLLDSNLRLKDRFIANQDVVIKSQIGTIKDMRSMITQYELGETELLGNIDNLKNDLNRKKRKLHFYQTAAFAAVAGIFINHYMWKFGK